MIRKIPAGSAVRLFRAARWVGMAVSVVAILLLVVMPPSAAKLAPGLHVPILAFEFARNREEVEDLFGPVGSDVRAAFVRRMDLGNQLDFAFMVLYGTLLLLMGLAFARLEGRRYLLVALLAPLAVLSDAAENLQLMAITRSLAGHYEDSLSRLFVFTWLKWGSLALALTWLGPALLRGSRIERGLGLFSMLVGLLAVGAFLDREHFSELFGLGVSTAIFGLFIVSLLRARSA